MKQYDSDVEDYYKNVVKNIRIAMAAEDLTCEEIGKQMGLTSASIVNKTNGVTNFYLQEIYQISRITGWSVPELVCGKPIRPQV